MDSIARLVRACVARSDHKNNNYFNVDITTQGGTISVFHIVAGDIDSMEVAQLDNEGADRLTRWVIKKDDRQRLLSCKVGDNIIYKGALYEVKSKTDKTIWLYDDDLYIGGSITINIDDL